LSDEKGSDQSHPELGLERGSRANSALESGSIDVACHLMTCFRPARRAGRSHRRQLSNPWRIGILNRAVPTLHCLMLIDGKRTDTAGPRGGEGTSISSSPHAADRAMGPCRARRVE
jgi:hypothetical protein